MWRADSLEKTLMLEKIEGRRRRGQQRTRWLYSLIGSMYMSLSKLCEMMENREAWCAAVHGVIKSWTWLSNWTILPSSQNKHKTTYTRSSAFLNFSFLGPLTDWWNFNSPQSRPFSLPEGADRTPMTHFNKENVVMCHFVHKLGWHISSEVNNLSRSLLSCKYSTLIPFSRQFRFQRNRSLVTEVIPFLKALILPKTTVICFGMS